MNRLHAIARTVRTYILTAALIVLLGPEQLPAAQEAGPSAGSQPAGQSAAKPIWRCQEAEYDFGTVWSGEKIDHTFTFFNDGNAPLRIIKVHTGCRCTTTDEYDKIVEPGQSGKLPVALNTTGYKHPVTKVIRVVTNDPENENVRLTLKGEVKPPVEVDPPSAIFGHANLLADFDMELSISNNTDGVMMLTPETGRDGIFSWKLEQVEPGQKAKLTITANEPFEDGTNRGNIVLKTGLKKQPEVKVYAQLVCPPVVECVPPMIWAPSPVTRSFDRRISIRYNGQGDMKILSAKCEDERIKPEIETVSDGKSYRMSITLPEGLKLDPHIPLNVVIETDLKEKPRVELPIKARPTNRHTARASRGKPATLFGQPAPEVSVQAPYGQPLLLGPTAGKVRVVNFWAGWCINSLRELKSLGNMSDYFKEHNVEVINISLDAIRPRDEIIELADHYGADDFFLGIDPEFKAAGEYGIDRLPTLLLIDAMGKIVAVEEGFRTDQPAMLKERIEMLSDGKSIDTIEPKDRVRRGQMCPVPWITHATDRKDLQKPNLSFESPRIFAGWFLPNESVDFKVFFRNEGRQALQLTKIENSENMNIKAGYPETIEAGQTGVFECQWTTPDRPGLFSHTIIVHSNDPARPKQLTQIVGEVQPLITFDPPSGIDFINPTDPAQETADITIEYNGREQIEFKQATSSSEHVQATLAAGQSPHQARLTVTLKKPLPVGITQAKVTVATNLQEMPTVDVPVRIYKQAPVEIMPTEIKVLQRTSRQRRVIMINNNTARPLKVLEVTSSTEQIQADIEQQQAGKAYRINLLIAPDFNCGDQQEQVVIRTDNEQYKEITVPVTMFQPQQGG